MTSQILVLMAFLGGLSVPIFSSDLNFEREGIQIIEPKDNGCKSAYDDEQVEALLDAIADAGPRDGEVASLTNCIPTYLHPLVAKGDDDEGVRLLESLFSSGNAAARSNEMAAPPSKIPPAHIKAYNQNPPPQVAYVRRIQSLPGPKNPPEPAPLQRATSLPKGSLPITYQTHFSPGNFQCPCVDVRCGDEWDFDTEPQPVKVLDMSSIYELQNVISDRLGTYEASGKGTATIIVWPNFFEPKR